jgi:hypothetical protein
MNVSIKDLWSECIGSLSGHIFSSCVSVDLSGGVAAVVMLVISGARGWAVGVDNLLSSSGNCLIDYLLSS